MKLASYTQCVQNKFSGECLVKFDKTVTELQRINRSCGLKVHYDLNANEINAASGSSPKKKLMVVVYVLLALYSKVFD